MRIVGWLRFLAGLQIVSDATAILRMGKRHPIPLSGRAAGDMRECSHELTLCSSGSIATAQIAGRDAGVDVGLIAVSNDASRCHKQTVNCLREPKRGWRDGHHTRLRRPWGVENALETHCDPHPASYLGHPLPWGPHGERETRFVLYPLRPLDDRARL